jgi:WD40 repeat protein
MTATPVEPSTTPTNTPTNPPDGFSVNERLPTNQPRPTTPVNQTDPINPLVNREPLKALACAPDSPLCAGVDSEQTIQVWNTKTGKSHWKHKNPHRVVVLAFARNDCLAIGDDAQVSAFSLSSKKMLWQWPIPTNSHLLSLTAAPNGRHFIAAISANKSAALWRLEAFRGQAQLKSSLSNHRGLTPAKDVLIVGATNSTTGDEVLLWQPATGNVRFIAKTQPAAKTTATSTVSRPGSRR